MLPLISASVSQFSMLIIFVIEKNHRGHLTNFYTIKTVLKVHDYLFNKDFSNCKPSIAPGNLYDICIRLLMCIQQS